MYRFLWGFDRDPYLSSDLQMEKKITFLILFFFLCGCQRQRTMACSCFNGDDRLTVNISANNDDITLIDVNEVFVLPQDLLADEDRFLMLQKQLDNSCHIEGDKLIRNYSLILDGRYSFSMTKSYLEGMRYHCE